VKKGRKGGRKGGPERIERREVKGKGGRSNDEGGGGGDNQCRC
jgi:hypothetical protein